MQTKPKPPPDAAALRHHAELRLREQRSKAGLAQPEADPQRLVHELQVHQVELEMQNTELQAARDRAETLLEKYTDLYDFAPVGYCSLDDAGRILEVNLTGAALLGVERSRLLNRPWKRFVAPESRPTFLVFLEQVFAGAGKTSCEVTCLKEDGTPFSASFHGTSALSVSSPRKWCRVAISDITALKQAEETQLRMEILAVANQKLEREIARRQEVEQSLRQSQEQQARLLEQSQQMQQQLRRLSHQMLRTQEEERKRISRELHDQVTQTLLGINVHLEALAREIPDHPRRLKQQIARTQRLVAESVNIVHQFARELRPTLLDDLGLVATLHSYMKDFTKRTGIRVHFTTFASGRIEEMDSTIRTVFYRVAQEALTNVARHAQASRVALTLEKLPVAFRMEIADDGKAFQVERVLQPKRYQRLGLLGLRERVEMVGGRFSVKSVPGQGTTLQAEVPFTNALKERKSS